MRFAMEMKDRLCPPHLGKDRCLVFELLKGHFCLQDSAMGVGSTRESLLSSRAASGLRQEADGQPTTAYN